MHAYLLNHGGRLYLSSLEAFLLNVMFYSLLLEKLLAVRKQFHFKFESKIQPSVLSASAYISQRAALHSLESSAGRNVPDWIRG